MGVSFPTATETHISVLFFDADRAYKLLKPVSLSFLDYSDRQTRLAAARRELELNRRLAPDVYLGLADIWEGDELTDHMIVMRRMPDDRRLSRLVDDPGFDDCVRSVGRAIAAFHSSEPPVADPSVATPDAVRARWEDNFHVIRAHSPHILTPDDVDRAQELAFTYLDANHELFAQRIADGWIRDGHGDLIADDIFCLADGPRILDCLAFRDDFRISDVLADIGFLVMDLHRLAGPAAARALMRWYQEFGNEHHPASLAHHYVAYRAHVRVKVACLTHDAGQAGQAELARNYHDLALHHLERAQVMLVLLGGAPGVGKSTIAEHLSQELGGCRLVTDEIRKDLAGMSHEDHAFAVIGEGIYTPEMTAKAYAEMLREADLILSRGETVILDASWSRDHQRAQARQLAARHGVRTIEVECQVGVPIAQDRIERRLAKEASSSDATPALAAMLANRRDPWPEAIAFATAGPLPETLERASALLMEGTTQT